MGGIATKVSLEEFLANPEPGFHDFHELHNGEVVVVPPPTKRHMILQRRLARILTGLLEPAGFEVQLEFYFTLATNSRRADVAAMLQSRFGEAPLYLPLRGSPDLVIEILSPSNTALGLDAYRYECFNEGARQFWVINDEIKSVTVYDRTNRVALYDSTRESDIPLDEFRPGSVLSTRTIFE
jgi:Uma2 family endonuclease